MKKYYPVDFDEKGKLILGNAKDTPTSNSFIPTTWAPGGSDEEKQGLKSITISPAITTTPALESFFPIYWEDLTEEQKANGVTINLETTDAISGEYAVTITPTAEWYAFANGGMVSQNKGEAVQEPMLGHGDRATVSASVAESPDEEEPRYFPVMVVITKGGK